MIVSVSFVDRADSRILKRGQLGQYIGRRRHLSLRPLRPPTGCRRDDGQKSSFA
ncbi:Uncharacterised protein [Mycobacteroides abscessus subsp. abscessus]|nr:Uncharacterised protein [Mycobacteroides abscessus subsp. abscessus]